MELGSSTPDRFQSPDFIQSQKDPSISFSPDRNRFESLNSVGWTLTTGSTDMAGLVLGNKDPPQEPFNSRFHQQKNDSEDKVLESRIELQRRLERHIAHANLAPTPEQNGHHSSESPIKQNESRNGKLGVKIPSSPHHSSSGLDSRTKALLPPQRLAIPRKPNSTAISLSDSNSQEVKPLVQWDTDDSEEELSFFPQPKARLTDNMSVDNLSLSGEEDLHLTPPRLTPTRCPCDPRHLIQSHWGVIERKKCRIL